MKRYIIDEAGRAVNIPHYPYLYTDETGRNGFEFRIPRHLWYKITEREIIIGDTFLAYGGKRPDRYAEVSNVPPYHVTHAQWLRKQRRLARIAPSMPLGFYEGYVPAWRYPLVPVKKEAE